MGLLCSTDCYFCFSEAKFLCRPLWRLTTNQFIKKKKSVSLNWSFISMPFRTPAVQGVLYRFSFQPLMDLLICDFFDLWNNTSVVNYRLSLGESHVARGVGQSLSFMGTASSVKSPGGESDPNNAPTISIADLFSAVVFSTLFQPWYIKFCLSLMHSHHLLSVEIRTVFFVVTKVLPL